MRRFNIVYHVTRKYMMLNKKRTFTTFIGIVFMVLLMTCVFVGKDTAIHYMQDVVSQREGKWHYVLCDVTDAERQKVQELDYIQDMSESVPLGMAVFEKSANEDRPYLNIKAYGESCFDWYHVKLSDGRLPQNGKELILSNACLQDGAKVKLGEQIDAALFRRTFTGIQENPDMKTIFPYFNFFEIPYGETVTAPEQFPYYAPNSSFQENREMTGQSVKYTVVGFMEIPAYEKETAAGYAALTYLDTETLANADTCNLSLQLDFKQAPEDVGAVFKNIAGSGNVDCNDFYLSLTAESSDSTINQMVQLMTIFLAALIILASIILIYNVFNLSYRERCKYLGMLSSVGATARQKRSSVYYEAFYLLLFALPAGILSGFAVIQGGMLLLKPFLMKLVTADGLDMENVPVTLCISWRGVLTVTAVCMITVLLSAFLPARKISKKGVVESIRGAEIQQTRSYPMSRFVHRKHGAEKMLAHHAVVRQRRKKRGISLSITIFVVILLVTAFGVDMIHIILEMKTENQDMISITIDNDEGYLYCSSRRESEADESDDLYQRFLAIRRELETRTEVTELKEWYQAVWAAGIDTDSSFYSQEYMDAQMNVAKAYLDDQMSEEKIRKKYFTDCILSNACILVLDDRSLQDVAKKCGADYSMLADSSQIGTIVVNDIVVSTDNSRYETGKPKRSLHYDIAHISDLKQGEAFSAKLYPAGNKPAERQVFQVAGYADRHALEGYVSMNGNFTWLIMSKTAAVNLTRHLGGSDLQDMFETYLKIRYRKGSDQLLTDLKSYSYSSDSGQISFINNDVLQIQDRVIDAVRKIADIMLLCFVALTSVICLMNIDNSIGGRMADRRKEFAILRSVGMTTGQIRSMLLRETGRILISSGVTAVVISVLLISGMRYVLSSLFGKLLFQIPYELICLAVPGTAGAVIFMTLYSFAKENKRHNILEEIRSETV